MALLGRCVVTPTGSQGTRLVRWALRYFRTHGLLDEAARGPPQGDLLLDQTPAFDPSGAEPEPDFGFDQSLPSAFED